MNFKKIILNFLFFSYIALIFLWMDGFYFFDRFKAIGLNVQGNFGISEYIRQVVFVVEYFFAVAAIYFASNIKKPWGVLCLLIFWLLVIIDVVAHEIYGRPADLGNIAVLNASVANIGDAVNNYSSLVFFAVVKTGVLFIPTLVKNIFRKNIRSMVIFAFVIVVLALIYGIILVKRGTPALIGFPKGFSYGLGTVALSVNNILSVPNNVKSTQLEDARVFINEIKNIIVIIDESIEYKVFSEYINSRNSNIVNYGLALSGGNCSASSNYIIRKGYWERSDENAIDIKEVDSFFEVAKRNNFKTTYIDNQGVLKDPTTRNYIDNDEFLFIDVLIENQDIQYLRDQSSISQIIDIVKSGRNFVLINKNGAHFPYENTIAPHLTSENRFSNYRMSVKINAAEFIERLANEVSSDTIIFYTSDHGQDLESKGTHCNTGDNISFNEYAVPFLIITSNEKIKNELLGNKLNIKNKLTHIEFSESIRNMMGEKIIGASSVFNYIDPKYDYCGLYGQPIKFFGALPSCKKLIAPDAQH